MTNIMPYNSRSLSTKDVFKRFFGDDFFGGFDSMMTGVKGFCADIRESDKEYLVEAELPGVAKEDIELSLHDDVLTISAKKDETRESGNEGKFIRRERFSGSVARSFYVENVDEEAISAKLENGILKITLPKAEIKRHERKIDIK